MCTFIETPEVILKQIVTRHARRNEEEKESYRSIKDFEKDLEDVNGLYAVNSNITSYEPSIRSEILIKIIQSDHHMIDMIRGKIISSSLRNLDSNLAMEFIKHGKHRLLVHCLRSFSNLDYIVAEALITKNAKIAKTVGLMIERFNILDHKKIAILLIEMNYEMILEENLESFSNQSLVS